MRGYGDGVKFSLFPHLLNPLSFFSREGVEDHTGSHSQEADEKGEVVRLGGICMIDLWKGFHNPSDERHEDGCACHGEKIYQCHDGSRDRDGKKFFGMRVDDHSKTAKETHEKEEESI